MRRPSPSDPLLAVGYCGYDRAVNAFRFVANGWEELFGISCPGAWGSGALSRR